MSLTFKVTIISCLLMSMCILSMNAANIDKTAKIVKRSSFNDGLEEQKDKRSPFLRLDELSSKIYLAKNKLGGGLIDPLEIGKRSNENQELILAQSIYEGLKSCVSLGSCNEALRLMIEDF